MALLDAARQSHWRRLGKVMKSFKLPLHKVLKGTVLTYQAMMTLLRDIESQVNDRPLYSASEDTLDVLTPSMLVFGRCLRPWIDRFATTGLKQDTSIRERWRQRAALANIFWNLWQKRYQTELQQRAKWFDTKPNLKVGDLVRRRD